MPATIPAPRVLVVEDDEVMGRAMEAMLDHLGFGVVGVVGRVNEALAAIRDRSVDAVVMDVDISGDVSLSLADELLTRTIPFVLMSGYDRESLPAAYAQRPFLMKPFRMSKLEGALVEIFPDLCRSGDGGGK